MMQSKYLKIQLMKKKYLLVFMLVAMTTIWSCTKDNSLDNRDNYVATYSVTETWTENSVVQSKPAFAMTIQKSSLYIDKILLNNFANYGTGITAEATIEGTAITIPQQTLSNSKGIIGTGTLADPVLTFTYTETLGSNSVIVTATANKR
jgi:hypothetical protein